MESERIYEKTDVVYKGKIYYPKEYKNTCYIMAASGIVSLVVFILLILTRATEENTVAIITIMISEIIRTVILAVGYTRFGILVKEDCLFVTPMFLRIQEICVILFPAKCGIWYCSGNMGI